MDENHIILDCNHKFNLLSLYNEVVKQKTVVNTFEITHLKINEIKCPYCREITNKLLPYQDISGINHIRGVNYPTKYCISIYKCEYKMKTGKNKGCNCSNPAFKTDNGILCNKHNNYIAKKYSKQILDSDDNLIYKKYNIQRLKEILKSLDLKVTGNKSILIERLKSVNYQFEL